jgi:hypothetical protein
VNNYLIHRNRKSLNNKLSFTGRGNPGIKVKLHRNRKFDLQEGEINFTGNT